MDGEEEQEEERGRMTGIDRVSELFAGPRKNNPETQTRSIQIYIVLILVRAR